MDKEKLELACKILTSMLSTNSWETCREPFEAVIRFIRLQIDYKNHYDVLYDNIRKALGEERYIAARDEVLESGNQGLNTMLMVAIEKLRDEAGDFDHTFWQVD